MELKGHVKPVGDQRFKDKFTEEIDKGIKKNLPVSVLKALEKENINTLSLYQRIKDGIASGEAAEIDGLSGTKADRWYNLEARTLLEGAISSLDAVRFLTTAEHAILTDKVFRFFAAFFKKKIKDGDSND